MKGEAVSEVEQKREVVTWQKARASMSNGNCIEVASYGGGIAVRDSKNPNGPTLFYTASEWQCFIQGVREGDFDDLISGK